MVSEGSEIASRIWISLVMESALLAFGVGSPFADGEGAGGELGLVAQGARERVWPWCGWEGGYCWEFWRSFAAKT